MSRGLGDVYKRQLKGSPKEKMTGCSDSVNTRFEWEGRVRLVEEHSDTSDRINIALQTDSQMINDIPQSSRVSESSLPGKQS